ncbi:MAG: beta-Ala-His dipeptidase [Promethearchaeota archaeon]
MVLENLEPKIVWHIFEEIIAKTPRRSKKEDKIRNKIKSWLIEQAELKRLEIAISEDAVGNILIKKPATKGMESVPPLLLQAHLDMVCETDRPEGYDFDENGIPIRIQDNSEWIDADGTTLGADDGIGVALASAILTDNEKVILHGPIEVLFTVNEENGFTGATNLDVKTLDIKSNYLINLDSGPIGEITIGSVCGRRTYFRKEFEWLKQDSIKNLLFFELTVDGLLGGHSGGDIHLPRANANKLISRILSNISQHIELYLCRWNGGTVSNAITRDAEVKIAFNSKDEEVFENLIQDELTAIYDYYKASREGFPILEPNINITWNKGNPERFLSAEDTKLIIYTTSLFPQGVLKYSPFYENFPESSNNFAIVWTKGNRIIIRLYPRSIIRSELNSFVQSMVQLGELGDWQMELRDILPEWKPQPESKFLKYAKEQYESILQKPVKSSIVHGGLETGRISQKIPGIQMISIGPTIDGEHTPNEKLKIVDVGIIYEILIKILQNFSKLEN